MQYMPFLQKLSAKEEVKRRLRMVLVADRCGMSPASLSEMKNTIIKALQVSTKTQYTQYKTPRNFNDHGHYCRSVSTTHRACNPVQVAMAAICIAHAAHHSSVAQDYVDIEGEDGIEVSISNEPGLGTVYSVNIPIRRVKVRGWWQGTVELGGSYPVHPCMLTSVPHQRMRAEHFEAAPAHMAF